MLPEYIKKNSYDLKSVTSADFEDLQPLKGMLENVKVVGLGESTHGTKEFFQLKHRLVRFLVEEMGYRTFILEAGMIPCMNINEYISSGKGDRAKALASQSYWTWDTEEVGAMLDWMLEHNMNCSRGEEVKFYGVDVKPVPEAVSILKRINEKAELFEKEKINKILDEIFILDDEGKGDGAECRKDAIWLMGILTFNELSICRRCGRAEYDLALACARTLCQYIDSMILAADMSVRDILMADNVMRLLNSLPPDEKVVIWAHNYHISTFESEGYPCMGSILRRRLGSKYFPFALTFGKGSFQSRLIEPDDSIGDLQEFSIEGPRKGFWEKDLVERGGSFYFNIKEAAAKDFETRDWANRVAQLFGAGGGYIPLPEESEEEEQFFSSYNLYSGFDGLFFVDETTRAVPNPTGMRYKNQRTR